MESNNWEKEDILQKLSIEDNQGISGLIIEDESLQALDVAKQHELEELKKSGDEKKTVPQNVIAKLQQSQVEQLDVSSALRRIFMTIEDGEWEDAERILYRIQNEEKNNPKFWIAKLLCKYKVRKEERLARLETDFSDDSAYKTAINCANGEYKEKIKTYCHYCIYAKVRKQLPKAPTNKYPGHIITWLKQIEGYSDADSLLEDYCKKSYQYALYLRESLPEKNHVIEISRILQNLPELDQEDELLQYSNRMRVVLEKRCRARDIISNMDRENGENWLESARWYMESGDFDYAYYCFSYASKKGRNTDRERKELISMTDEAIQRGREGYLFYRGIMYYYEEKDYENAKKCFEEAYEKKEPYSGFGMGALYFFAPFKDNPYEHNVYQAMGYFKEVSDRRNDPESMDYYARCCMLLEEEGTDYKRLVRFYENSIWWFPNSGRPELYCARLYWWLNYRNGNLQQDFERARNYYQRAIKKKNLDAMEDFVLGIENDENPYPEEVLGDAELWKEIKKCCEILFEKKRYGTACIYAQFFAGNIEGLDMFSLDTKRQAEILLEAGDAGEVMAIAVSSLLLLQDKIPNLRGWDWLISQLDKFLEMDESEEDKQEILQLKSQIEEKRKREDSNYGGIFHRFIRKK